MSSFCQCSELVRAKPNKVIDDINNKKIDLSDLAVKSAMNNFQYLQNAGRGGTPTFIYLINSCLGTIINEFSTKIDKKMPSAAYFYCRKVVSSVSICISRLVINR